MKFIKTDNPAEIETYRGQLYKRLTAPIDAMWEQLYIASSQTYLVVIGNQKAGYCCIDSNKSLLQLFLPHDYLHLMDEVVRALIESDLMVAASLSSNDPIAFNTCLFHAKQYCIAESYQKSWFLLFQYHF